MNNQKKVISKNVEDQLVESIIEQLKKNQCTFANFESISKRVQRFFEENATI